MVREQMTFAQFAPHFVGNYNGYLAVDMGLQEDYDGVFQKIVELDLICDWRIDDGKIKLLSVSFDTGEELETIREWVRGCARQLAENVLKRAENVLGLDTLFKRQWVVTHTPTETEIPVRVFLTNILMPSPKPSSCSCIPRISTSLSLDT